MFLFRRKHENDPVQDRPPYLIVGLGNPGREYRDSRHNVGFMVIDHFSVNNSIRMGRVQFKAITGSGNIGEDKILLIKPQTFMNLSGKSVSSFVRFHKVPFEKILVIHDDMDLAYGTIRLRPKGGSGGQKGLASIISELGRQDFPRLRIGIGRPPGYMDPADYVLESFLPSELNNLKSILDRAVETAQVFINKGLDESMNQFNGSILD